MKIKPFITLNDAEHNQAQNVNIDSDFKPEINHWYKKGILLLFLSVIIEQYCIKQFKFAYSNPIISITVTCYILMHL